MLFINLSPLLLGDCFWDLFCVAGKRGVLCKNYGNGVYLCICPAFLSVCRYISYVFRYISCTTNNTGPAYSPGHCTVSPFSLCIGLPILIGYCLLLTLLLIISYCLRIAVLWARAHMTRGPRPWPIA